MVEARVYTNPKSKPLSKKSSITRFKATQSKLTRSDLIPKALTVGLEDQDDANSLFTEFKTNCSVTCGFGVKSVVTINCKRSCFPECCQRTVEETSCEKPKCTKKYGHWTPWTECDKPCITEIDQRSVKTRFRMCLNCDSRQYGKFLSKIFLKN